MSQTAKNVASRQLLYLNESKVRELHAQLAGGVPTARRNSSSFGGAASAGEAGARLSVAADRRASTEVEVSDPALSVSLIGILERKRLLVPDRSIARFNGALDKSIRSGQSFLACVSGRFSIPQRSTIRYWLSAVGESGYVSLFLDSTDKRAVRLKSKGFESGIWVGMNTDCILDRHKRGPDTSHLAVRLRAGQGWLTLSAIGWVEGNGYINPLSVYW